MAKIRMKLAIVAALSVFAAISSIAPVHAFAGEPAAHRQTVTNIRGYVAAVKQDRSLWALSTNSLFYQSAMGLLNGPYWQMDAVPFRLMDDVIAVAGTHSSRVYGEPGYGGNLYALQADGSLWFWENRGYWVRFQSADGEGLSLTGPGIDLRAEPAKLMGNVRAVAAGVDFTLAVTNDNTLWTWGANHRGQLGDGSNFSRTEPLPVMSRVAYAGAGRERAWAVTLDGGLYVWGWDNGSHLGMFRGSKYFLSVPTRVKDGVIGASQNNDFIATTFVILEDRSLWAWGSNQYGQLGAGRPMEAEVPVKILENVTRVWADIGNAIAVTQDGSVWMWGWNHLGQFGDDSPAFRFAPVRPASGIAAATDGFTFVLTDQGLLKFKGVHVVDGPGLVRHSPVYLLDSVMLPE